jgi:DNA-binding NarL/FixJ family response regulator
LKHLQHAASSGDFSAEFLEAGSPLVWGTDNSFHGIVPGFGIAQESEVSQIDEISTPAMTIGLIDCYRFSQECLIKALEILHPRLTILPFTTVESCIAERRTDLDLIIYYSHASGASDTTPTDNVSAVGQAFPAVPFVVLSDADDAQQVKTIRSALKSGAHGFIPTRTTGIPIAIAAIRFVKAGGMFAPMDLMLASKPEQPGALPDTARQNRLTSRQMAVLGHMQQGNANKIIAHELGMSESTVKVHVRNIMRKVGATNRTQAVYKARKLLENVRLASASER